MNPFSQVAARLDEQDPLSDFRRRFLIDDDYIYLDGNSLGRLPIETVERISETVTSGWGRRLVLGWDSWLSEGSTIGDRLAPLIGASEGEVAVADQTSINLYKLAASGLAATGRPNIVTDRGNFPSDRYILGSIAEAAGGRLILVPEDPTIADLAESIDQGVGLVSLSHVSYRTGTLSAGAEITELVHDRGALMLWDLAHSVGSVPVELNAWNADLAVGCTYKYLNAGPGAPGFLYVREDLQGELAQPITGWFGHADQFGFADDWEPADDLRRFLVGTPPIISMVGVGVGVDLTLEAGIGPIRRKSLALSSLFIDCVEPLEKAGLKIVTPLRPNDRGSHITVAHAHGYQIAAALRDRGVIPDFRTPNLIRFGFTPLYTTFAEVVQAAEILGEILDTRSYESYSAHRTGVT